jgi:hypothetical protein
MLCIGEVRDIRDNFISTLSIIYRCIILCIGENEKGEVKESERRALGSFICIEIYIGVLYVV